MLQIKHVKKQYQTGSLIQKALDDVSLNLRDNEFVAILGPSGSGKTTLLNIIGGLDRYDSGDLVINGISTKNYRDRDWDSYRNHTIGFVFQSYNLIPHQTILSNVELALTISGISKQERKKRALHALSQVGLDKQYHKKPSQLSGGQMQRVAIARALVNDPDILLADEPTGALDSDTSVQVMDLLKEVAKDRLVVMVTHNPELADEYATRIVKLKDGKILSDSDVFEVDEKTQAKPRHQTMGKTSMSLLTSLSLSFNNLKTKKGRTILTSFAGSIGIIGIAAILSLSNGVNQYIKDIEEETLSEYPLQIQSTGFDMTSMLVEPTDDETPKEKKDVAVGKMLTTMFSTIGSNDLTSLQAFLESGKSDIEKYTTAIEYNYPIQPQIYSASDEVRQVHPDQSFASLGFGSGNSTNSMMSSMMSTDVFRQLPKNESLYRDQYDMKAGRWPKGKQECVLVLTPSGKISDFFLYTLGLRDAKELEGMLNQFNHEEEVDIPETDHAYDYEELLGINFKLVNASDYYTYDEAYDVWVDKTKDDAYMKELVKNGETLSIVGIVQPKEHVTAMMLPSGIYYPSALTDYVMKQAQNSAIVKAQLANPQKNIFTGKDFDTKEKSTFDMSHFFTVDEKKIAEAFQIDESKMNVDMSGLTQSLENIKLPPLDFNEILSKVQFEMTPTQLERMINALNQDFMEYGKTHPELDIEALQKGIETYLQSPEATAILRKGIEDAIKENGSITITPEQMQKILSQVWAGYEPYAKDHDLPSFKTFQTGFIAYLQSAQAKAVMANQLSLIMEENDMSSQLQMILANYMSSISHTVSQTMQMEMMKMMQEMGQSMTNAFSFDADAFRDAIVMNADEKTMSELMTSMMSRERYTYEGNLKKLGYAKEDEPSMISIYPKDFESKEQVLNILDGYNEDMKKVDEAKVVSYTDMVGTLMSSVSDIVNVISYVLVAFVSISLIVSSIMIGVITYISVLERKKEIGILRAIGASKRNISEVFNAETFIIGLLAGVIGIIVTLLLLIPANAIIHEIAGNTMINASLPITAAIILIVLSTILTLIGGIIPSRKAAKEDPVTALRTE